MDYLLSADLATGFSLIDTAQEQEREQRIWLQWAIQLPAMALVGKYTSYSDYRDNLTGVNIDTRPTSEILEELDELEKQFERSAENGA